MKKQSYWSTRGAHQRGSHSGTFGDHVRDVRESVDGSKGELLHCETDDTSETADVSASVLARMMRDYEQGDIKEHHQDSFDKLQQKMSDVIIAGSAPCVICYCAMKNTDAIWSCSRCYCAFHLQCIQQWANDSTSAQLQSATAKLFPNRPVQWTCPKCRQNYSIADVPIKYKCYCGKKTDPPSDPWMVPHSCGEVCGKSLGCGHSCRLLCHPGACPACPITITVTCYCGRGVPQMKRCGSSGWSCGKVCRKVLSCGLHICEDHCHAGICKLCSVVAEEECVCGRETVERQCGSAEWHCSNPCSKPLPCGHHYCEKVCHSDSCGECPRAGTRTCQCGKSVITDLPCTEESPTCGDTCGRLLPCGEHYCVMRCHAGPCEACRQLRVKSCRCGKHKRSVLCTQPYFCEEKCTNLRQCGIHQCKRKCCDGNCPPCEQTCNKTLSCRKHKCAAPCHLGPCYPCPLTVEIRCACGSAMLTVPCGCERETTPPPCKQPCRTPPSCHHKERKPHSCHFGFCPPCRQKCDKSLDCGHTCVSPCHSEPKQKHSALLKGQSKKGRQEQETCPAVDTCPPCSHLIAITCKGGHETVNVKCSKVKEYSCGLPCGRVLACGNHTCQKVCHSVTNQSSHEGFSEECQICEEMCAKSRPQGCSHQCPLPCHSGPCPSCLEQLKLRCHCGLFPVVISCIDWNEADEHKRNRLQSCSGECPKLLPCGHQCSLICHHGDCTASCEKRVTLRCPCKRLKRDVKCHLSESTKIACDDECKRILQKEKEKRRLEREAKQAEEERLQQEIQDNQMALLQGKKKKKRKRREFGGEEKEERWWSKYRTNLIVFTLLLSIISMPALIYWAGKQ